MQRVLYILFKQRAGALYKDVFGPRELSGDDSLFQGEWIEGTAATVTGSCPLFSGLSHLFTA